MTMIGTATDSRGPETLVRSFAAATYGAYVEFDRWTGPWRWKRHTTPTDLPGISYVRAYVDVDGHQGWRMITKLTVG